MRSRRTVSLCTLLALATVHLAAQTSSTPPKQPGGSIAFNAPNAIRSMDPSNTTYSSIQITNGKISALSGDANPNAINLPAGAAIYPGFIDTHSHAISLLTAQSRDPKGNPYWISLANVNVMLLPDCATPTPGSTNCFTPVTTQATVISLLQNATPNAAGWILGWNYEPSRLVCSGGYGFQCPNFENQTTQTALEQLDAIRTDYPVLVTSESGHVVYVNSKALGMLGLCLNAQNTNCYTPTVNPAIETALAQTGQLNEDMALYAIGKVEGILGNNYAGGPCATTDNACKAKVIAFNAKQIRSSLNLYSQLGYTTVQEGAASAGLIQLYMDIATAMTMLPNPAWLPVTMAFLEYDGTTAANFGTSISTARNVRTALTNGNFDMFHAGMKVYADGSTQAWTADLLNPPVQYQNVKAPFNNSQIFPQQPYNGLPDYTANDLATAAKLAHQNGFPLWVHANGNEAQINVLGALESNPSPGLRDIVVHFTMPTFHQVQSIPPANIGVTFLTNDFYYYFQPLCEQMLGPAVTASLYPAVWAAASNVHYSLHSDASVTPISPMFGFWVATTRNYQKNSWLPPLSQNNCPSVNTSAMQITPLRAMRAYTSEAAWFYNRETSIGSLQSGFNGDLVVLSADPLSGADPSTIYVLYTVHNGNIVYPASGQAFAYKPVWPK